MKFSLSVVLLACFIVGCSVPENNVALPTSHVISCLCFADKPGPPRDITVRGVTESSATLRWSPPEQDGGSDITGYTVERREGFKRTWQHVGTTASTQITAGRSPTAEITQSKPFPLYNQLDWEKRGKGNKSQGQTQQRPSANWSSICSGRLAFSVRCLFGLAT